MNASPDKNVETIRQKLLDRSVVGLVKYGVTTERTDIDHNGWLNHLQEELLDAAIYIEAANKSLNLYVLTQEVNPYNAFDTAVVVAASKEEALLIHPRGLSIKDIWNLWEDWCEPEYVQVTYTGKAAPYLKSGDIVCSSYIQENN
jgi:hypothetical protein